MLSKMHCSLFISLAAPGLSCSTWDLSLQHTGSSSPTRNGTQAPPLPWEYRVLLRTTREVLQSALLITVDA